MKKGTKTKPKYKVAANRLFYNCGGKKGGCNWAGATELKSNIKVKC